MPPFDERSPPALGRPALLVLVRHGQSARNDAKKGNRYFLVLAVTHGMTIRTFRFLLERWMYEEAGEHFREERIPNCAVTTCELDPVGQLKLARLAETFAGQK